MTWTENDLMDVKFARMAYTPAATPLTSFLRYSGAGVIGTAIHFLVLFAALDYVGPVAASTMGAFVGCIINYSLSRQFVFASTTSCAHSLPRFVSVALLGIAVNAVIIKAFVGVLPIALNQAIASGTVLLLGYALNKKWTFNER